MKQPDTTGPQATVREVDGNLVLNDPAALSVARAVGKHNCRATAELNADRVAHFTGRIAERGLSANDALIVIINMDDPFGSDVGDALMPGHDWQAHRDRGEVPFARGLAGREGIQAVLDGIDPDAAAKLRGLATAVVVFDHGTVEVFEAASISGSH